jgi:HEAT repeat protein
MSEDYIQQFDLIISGIKSSNWRVRNPAVRNMEVLSDPGYFEYLVEALNNEQDPTIQIVAASFLARTNYTQAFEVLLHLLQNGSATTKASAAVTLGRYKVIEAVEPLTLILQNKSNHILLRIAAAKALGEIEDERALEPLTQVYLDVTDKIVDVDDQGARDYASQSLTKFGAQVLPLFRSNLTATDSKSRLLAAKALGILADQHSVAALINTLNDSDDYVRLNAITALGLIGDKTACDPIYKLMMNEMKGWLQWAQAVALGKLGDERALELLVNGLINRSLPASDRTEAAYLLGELGSPRAIQPLQWALSDKNGLVRVRSAEALSKIGDKSVLPKLEWVLENSSNVKGFDEEAKKAVLVAIEKLKNSSNSV